MPDMEKVIKGLECHQIDKDHRINCSDCPYHCDEFMNGLNELHNDALALLTEQQEEIENLKQTAQSMMEGICLLKEQGSVEPESEHHLFVCPVCRSVLRREQKFCHECGKPILWEGR